MHNLLIALIVIVCIAALCIFTFSRYNRTIPAPVKVGQMAPQFTLPDETGTPRSLAQFKGKKIVLYFYPKDETPGCTTEACGLRDSYDAFAQRDIVVLGVSYDTVESHKKFKEKEHLPSILLADTNHEVAHLYGTDLHPMGSLYASRKTFLINEQGKIIHIFDEVTPENHASDVLKAFGY